MNTAPEIQQEIGKARSLVRSASEEWVAGNNEGLVVPALLSSAVEIVRRADVLLLAAPLNIRRCAQSQAAALSQEVAEFAQLVDSSAAFYRGIAARVQGAGAAYDCRGLAASVPELGSPQIEV